MGTQSTIAKKNDDGTFTGIYCHYEGYPEFNGRLLKDHYTTSDKVDELLSLGDLSSLGERIGKKHCFNEHQVGECTFYGRDRGEDDVDSVTFKTLEELLMYYGDVYTYVFDFDGQWKLANENGGLEEF